MEVDAEIYSEVLGGASRDQSKIGRSNNKSMMVKPTEAADLS